jgi:hypothetical protein
MCLRKNKKGSYNIVHPGRKRFANDVEVAIADFIISGDAKSLNRVPDSDPFFVGAAIESACNGLDIDCGNYYRTIFTIMSAGFGAWGGAYPSPGTGPNVAGNNTVPSSMQRDVFGDPDCPGCGYDWHLSISQAPGNPRTTVLGFGEDVEMYKNINVNSLLVT